MSLDNFDPKMAHEIVERAAQIAERHDHEYVTLEHLLGSLLQDQQVLETLTELEADCSEISADLLAHYNSGILGKANGKAPRQTAALVRVVNRVVAQCFFGGRDHIRAIDILISILTEKDENCHACYFLAKHGVTDLDVKLAVSHGGDFDDDEVVTKTNDDGEEASSAEDDKGPKKSKAEKLLEKFCVNLNDQALAGKIDPLIGRESEIASLVLTTARRTKNNAVLVGEPGVGKQKRAPSTQNYKLEGL